ncbi:Cullin-associated NEDD8-dissociated protein 1 [Vitis vinifera]|uniref:Cullin-associated NEDD8-dissociated protein 1 n=1 Tax=Vitis vinifera TaxID=29760 RepID=A0A438E9T0_VITVI|nr:Cullin-associated NEDD8-dissociated protein 1 [Vitis vinifera]
MTFWCFSRAVGYRFGSHLGDTVPVLINYCTSASENDEELREYSLQALESFLLRCPRDISSYCDEILHLTLEYLSYDPNFTDNMEEDTDDENHEEEEDEYVVHCESATEYTDDEDASWKVRRAAAKCLAALIVSRPEMLSKLYEEACPKLIDRFKEREENVKMDVFNTFIELLRQTGNVTKGQTDMNELRVISSMGWKNVVLRSQGTFRKSILARKLRSLGVAPNHSVVVYPLEVKSLVVVEEQDAKSKMETLQLCLVDQWEGNALRSGARLFKGKLLHFERWSPKVDCFSPRWLLKQEVPKIVKSINRQLREKTIKTKVGAFSVLKELVVVLPDCLADHIGSLISGIEKALSDKSSTSNLKIEALIFTRLVLASHSPSVFHPYIKRERAREGERECDGECDGEEGEESLAPRSRRKECSFTVESKAFEIVVDDRKGKIQVLIVEKKGGVSSWVRLGLDNLGFFLEGLNLCIKDEKEARWGREWKEQGRMYSMTRGINRAGGLYG